MKNSIKNKKAPEEMVGFALIIIIVAVILVIFLGISLSKNQKDTVESYEVESFIQAFIQHTSDCRNNLEYLSVQKLISGCAENEMCLDGRSECDVLKNISEKIAGKSWEFGEDRPIKGYELRIISNNQEMVSLDKGEKTKNYKGSSHEFVKSGSSISVEFKAYYK